MVLTKTTQRVKTPRWELREKPARITVSLFRGRHRHFKIKDKCFLSEGRLFFHRVLKIVSTKMCCAYCKQCSIKHLK